MKRLRIGVIGAGWVTRVRHLPRLQVVDEVDVCLIWSRQRENAENVAEQFGIPQIADSWKEVANASDLDAIIVTTPPIHHCEHTLEALESGKHVLCQGRMARNLREARQMRDAAENGGLVAGLYPPYPGLKGDRVVRRLLQEGFVGEICEVRVSGLSLSEPPDDYVWQLDPEVVGVNTMTLGLWAEVLNRWVGPARAVTAMGKTHRTSRRTIGGDRAPAIVPDSLVIAAELVCGASASYHFSTVAACGPAQIEIFGERGGLTYKMVEGELFGGQAGDVQKPIEIPESEVRDQTTDSEWVVAILSGGEISPNFHDGIAYMEFSEAVALSMMDGRRIELPLVADEMDSWGKKH